MFEVSITEHGDFSQARWLGFELVKMPAIATENAKKRALNAAKDKSKKNKMGTTMKWDPSLSTFVLNKMCDIISSGVRQRV